MGSWRCELRNCSTENFSLPRVTVNNSSGSPVLGLWAWIRCDALIGQPWAGMEAEPGSGHAPHKQSTECWEQRRFRDSSAMRALDAHRQTGPRQLLRPSWSPFLLSPQAMLSFLRPPSPSRLLTQGFSCLPNFHAPLPSVCLLLWASSHLC